jgi:VWA domain-containing protein
MSGDGERRRRWTLALGVQDEGRGEGASPLSDDDRRMSGALTALYGSGAGTTRGSGGLSRSAPPRIAKWMGDIREFFPTPVVQIIQKDALERVKLREMVLAPEFLDIVQADLSLVGDLVALRSWMPEESKEAARRVVAKVVAELIARFDRRMADALRGAFDRSRRTSRPRFANIDWLRTIHANLRHYQAKHRTVVPERLIGFIRRQRRLVDLDEVILCVDQSGSMATSVIYASVFAAVMASLPGVVTKLICFDNRIFDMTGDLADPVEVLFGTQLGGGTDINRAVAYCEERIDRPSKAHLVLITDLYEGGDAAALIDRLAQLVLRDVNVIVLLALTDTGRPSYDPALSAKVAALGIPVFACTPDQFPELMTTALRREDIHGWAADRDIKLVRPEGGVLNEDQRGQLRGHVTSSRPALP